MLRRLRWKFTLLLMLLLSGVLAAVLTERPSAQSGGAGALERPPGGRL